MSKVKLIPLDDKNIEFARQLRNRYRNDFFTHDEITKEQQKMWYEKYRESYGKDYMWIITLGDGTEVGTISLYNINHIDRTAELGRILLDESARGNGVMESAILLVKDIAFEQMRLYKLKLSVYIDNTHAIAVYDKCGFTSLDRPVILMECKNPNMNWKKPMKISTYQDMDGEDGYEGQCTNIK
jgi:RimJ/RimL family protein N-acetyltransferase